MAVGAQPGKEASKWVTFHMRHQNLCGIYVARITEVLDPKGLRAGMNKTGHTKGLTHSGRE
jgi:hypothetical protein